MSPDADRIPVAGGHGGKRRPGCHEPAAAARGMGAVACRNSHYLRIYMGHLRHKLEDDPAQPRYLLTETAVGYRLFLRRSRLQLKRYRLSIGTERLSGHVDRYCLFSF